MSASGAAGGSVSGTAKVEGTNAAGDGTVAIPGFSTGMKFIVKGETAYLNFPTIKMISGTWYEVPVSELSAILFTTGYAENVSEEDLEEIDMIGMMLGLGEITVTEDDLSDIEAILTYTGQASGMTQEEINEILALVPQDMQISCKAIDDVPDSAFDVPSGAKVEEGLPPIVELYLGL
jgi:hypothetical protein